MLGNDNENRNCGCGCNMNNTMSANTMNHNMMNYDCSYTPQGINAAFGYNTASLNADDGMNCSCAQNQEECCANRREVRAQMLHELKCLNFAIIELALYLNTHSDDQRALCLHREYCRQFKDLKDKYQRIYGPLSIYYPCNKWRWLEEPWPWEGGID